MSKRAIYEEIWVDSGGKPTFPDECPVCGAHWTELQIDVYEVPATYAAYQRHYREHGPDRGWKWSEDFKTLLAVRPDGTTFMLANYVPPAIARDIVRSATEGALRRYECGGYWSEKSQIQNHTDKFWGECYREA